MDQYADEQVGCLGEGIEDIHHLMVGAAVKLPHVKTTIGSIREGDGPVAHMVDHATRNADDPYGTVVSVTGEGVDVELIKTFVKLGRADDATTSAIKYARCIR